MMPRIWKLNHRGERQIAGSCILKTVYVSDFCNALIWGFSKFLDVYVTHVGDLNSWEKNFGSREICFIRCRL